MKVTKVLNSLSIPQLLVAGSLILTGFVLTVTLYQRQPQHLPVRATLSTQERIVYLEVAKRPEEKAKGLMYRSQLAENQGMAFVVDPPQRTRLWMFRVNQELDLMFLYKKRILQIQDRAPGCNHKPCTIYDSQKPVDLVIELARGQATKLDLKVGDIVNLKWVSLT